MDHIEVSDRQFVVNEQTYRLSLAGWRPAFLETAVIRVRFSFVHHIQYTYMCAVTDFTETEDISMTPPRDFIPAVWSKRSITCILVTSFTEI